MERRIEIMDTMIFISSTFKDMQFERDIIHERVMPTLNYYARQYGESVSFCDLRWGVNTTGMESEESSKKVLSVCLDEIDRCEPYMIVILGERYGWIPDETLIKQSIALKKEFELDELEKSVTALEIEYGALKSDYLLKNTLFYFREFINDDIPEEYQKEDDYHINKLNSLKERIIKATKGKVKTYQVKWDRQESRISNLNEFVDMVIYDLQNLLKEKWVESGQLSKYERDMKMQWSYAEQKWQQHASRKDILDLCIKNIEKEIGVFAICGKSGSGKSTLMSKFAEQLQKSDRNVLILFCGYTTMCTTSIDIIKYMINYLEICCGLTHYEDMYQETEMKDSLKWINRLEEVIDIYSQSSNAPLVILIDGIDQLVTDEDRELLRFIPQNLSGRVQIVISCLDSFCFCRLIERIYLAELNENQKKEIIIGILSYIGKELDETVILDIVNKQEANNPLYISLLIQRLTMMNKEDFDKIKSDGDGINAINFFQKSIIKNCPDNLNALCVEILNVASERISSNCVQNVTQYLAVSRHGFRERDLEGIFSNIGIEWNSLEFSMLIQYLNSFFILREDGRFDFSHRSIRDGVLTQCKEQQKMQENILKYIQTMDEQDVLFAEEVTYHCILSNNYLYYVILCGCYINDTKLCDRIVKDTYELALLDGGEWICDLLKKAIEIKAGDNFLRFMNKLSASFVIISNNERNILQKILENLDAYIQQTKKLKTKISIQFVSEWILCLKNLALVFRLQGEMDKSIRIYLKAHSLIEQIDFERDENGWITRCACEIEYNIAEMKMERRNEKDMEDAFNLCVRAHKLAESLVRFTEKGIEGCESDLVNLMNSYMRVGVIYSKAFVDKTVEKSDEVKKEGRKIAIEWGEKALMLAEHFNNLGDYLEEVSNVYSKVAQIYCDCEIQTNINKELELLNKSLEISVRLANQSGRIEDWDQVQNLYSRLGQIYELLSSSDSEKMMEALDMYLTAEKLAKQAAECLDTVNSWFNLAMRFIQSAELYKRIENGNSFIIMKKYENASQILEKLYVNNKSDEMKSILGTVYLELAKIYKIVGEDANQEKTQNIYKKIVQLSNSDTEVS